MNIYHQTFVIDHLLTYIHAKLTLSICYFRLYKKHVKRNFLQKKKRKISFIKKNFFYKTQIIHVQLYLLFIPSFHTFLTHCSST